MSVEANKAFVRGFYETIEHDNDEAFGVLRQRAANS